MGITVADLLKLNIYRENAQVVVSEGLKNEVQYFTVMEAPDFHFDSLPWAPPSCYCRVFCLLFYHRSVKVSLDKFFKKDERLDCAPLKPLYHTAKSGACKALSAGSAM